MSSSGEERVRFLVKNEYKCGSFGKVEGHESSVLYSLSWRAWLLIEFRPLRLCLAK